MTNEERATFHRWLDAFNKEIVKDQDFVAVCASGGDVGLFVAGDIIARHAAILYTSGKPPEEAAQEVIATAKRCWREAEEKHLLSLPINGTH